MKTLKYMKESYFNAGDIYGGTDFPDAKPHINMTRLWMDSKGEKDAKVDNFISNFAKIMIHEFLHAVIDEVCLEARIDREEEIVDKISGTNNLSITDKCLFLKIN